MQRNPLTDVFQFLTATTGDYLALGAWRFMVLGLFWGLLTASVYFAYRNWQEDPAQRTGTNVAIWVIRVLIGCMWFEGMLWKLPLPASGGLEYWTGQMGTRAAFEFHRHFVTGFLLPHIALFGPVVFLSELFFAASMILGFAVRLGGTLAIVFVLHLWIGIYLPADPAEWSWSYIFLAMLMVLFAVLGAGRSLGLDAWLRRHVAAVRDGGGLLGRLVHLSG